MQSNEQVLYGTRSTPSDLPNLLEGTGPKIYFGFNGDLSILVLWLNFFEILNQAILIHVKEDASHPERLDLKARPLQAMPTEISFHDLGHLGIFP
jgi:hypothetical protein